MVYQTRHLVAQKPMRHEGRELVPGDDFHATEVDAKYYVQHHYATAHQEARDGGEAKPETKVDSATAAKAPPEVDTATGPVTSGGDSQPAHEESLLMTSTDGDKSEQSDVVETQPAALSTTDAEPPTRNYTRGRRGPASRS